MKLKKAYLRDRINSQLINLIFKFCRFNHDGKILVKSMDGIGDVLVRSKLAEMIIEKYGKENVVFLMKSQYKQFGEILGYEVFGVPRKSEKNFFKRLKMMYEINKRYNPKKFINIEFGNDSIVANISAPEKIGPFDEYEMVSYYNKYYTQSFKFKKNYSYVMDKIKDIANNVLNCNLNVQEIMPNLTDRFKSCDKKQGVVIAVGSSARDKVCSPQRMKNYILELNKYYSNEKIILVGNGNLQKEYAEKLIEYLPQLDIENMVDKTTLKEVFKIVANSILFVGFDSGLYNLCFTTKTKAIALFKNPVGVFVHNAPWIKVIGPEKELIDDFVDINYPNKEINNISIETFKKAVEELR